MTTLGSVSKGTFLFKGKKRAANIEKYIENGKCGVVKAQIGEDLWETINQKIQLLQSDLNTQIFDELVQYVENAQTGFVVGDGSKSRSTEIPTAALVTGVNMPDHDVMFSNMTSLIHERVTPHVAVLKSKDCPNLKSFMSKTIQQLMENVDVEHEEDEDIDSQHQISVKKVTSTMSSLASWYKEISKTRASSPRKKRKSSDGRSLVFAQCPPVVVVMEDFEGFPANVLQDFVTICSNYLKEIPFILVFGIATAVTAVHRLMPHAVSSLLCMEKFQAPPSSEYLSHVIDEIILTPDVPFKLGARAFNILLDIFLYHNFSVFEFVRGLDFALMDHFTNETSPLCQSLEDALNQLKGYTHTDLEHVRRLQSFRRHVEKCEPAEQIALLTDDKYTKKAICNLLEDLEKYHKYYFPVLRCLHAVTSKLARHPLGKQLREMYALNLKCNICDTEDYNDATQLLRLLSRDELVLMLQKCSLLLKNYELVDLEETRQRIAELTLKFDNIEELSKTHGDSTEDEEEQSAAALPKQKMDMYTLRQKLQEMGSKKKKLTVYEVLRNETIDLFDNLFRKYLLCPVQLSLHEIYYYNNSANIRYSLNASSRGVIQRGLATPHHYIQNKKVVCDPGVIDSSLLDLNIVYKLHLECGRLINLYDWLQAFITIVQGGNTSKKNAKKVDQILQARFIRAVSELQFLGFVKPTKRKTDHVSRLTWGGC